MIFFIFICTIFNNKESIFLGDYNLSKIYEIVIINSSSVDGERFREPKK